MKLASLFAIALLIVCVPFAHADVVLYIGIDGGSLTQVEDVADSPISPQIIYPGTTFAGGKLAVQLVASGNDYPGSSTLAQELTDTFKISNSDTIAHTIEFLIVAQDFAAPVTPPAIDLTSQIGGSDNPSSGTSTYDFTSCVDTTNSKTLGCPAAYTTSTGTVGIPGTSFSGASSALISSLAAPYAIDEDLVLSVGVGDTLNFSGNTTLQSVPEPGSIGWMAGGMILLAGLYKRFRSAKQA